jgi:small neutral amino acid transporter SnatA (MarC family)
MLRVSGAALTAGGGIIPLRDRGLTAVERLKGMLLVIVAVEMLLKGVAEYLAAP